MAYTLPHVWAINTTFLGTARHSMLSAGQTLEAVVRCPSSALLLEAFLQAVSSAVAHFVPTPRTCSKPADTVLLQQQQQQQQPAPCPRANATVSVRAY